ncbi:GspE/PulE family protein [Adhaeretor mobilis]|uniref:Type II secretion system protein E n=1 Tax=Adhaeretor mobilis TaxID=1930276 RepID=A0A517N1I7_9BACT|nr:ATPase, T2SS/T4P/T4SS family [Adhaeretor mobilis]QDT00993.1 Type II secretion system protein E [Adhaeretor mobilis]
MRQLWLVLLLLVLGFNGALAPGVACAAAKDDAAKKAAEAQAAADAQAFKVKSKKMEVDYKATVESIGESRDSSPWLWIVPFGLFTAVLLSWVGFGDWVNRDTQTHKIGWHKWNPVVFSPFAVLAIALFFVDFNFLYRIPILLVAFVASAIPYILTHNKSVQKHQTVLTREWWRYAFSETMGKLGVKIDTERKAQYELGAAVDLMAMGAEDANADNANLLIARQSPGYLILKDLVSETVTKRADRVMLDYTQQAVNVRHEIDGMWHSGEPRDRESGDVLLAVLKTLANLDVKERRKKQKGKLGAKFEGKNYLLPITSEGTKSGERVVLEFIGKKASFSTFEDLGMRDGLQEKWSELMARDKGLLVFSSMPGGGMSTLTNVSLDETDRLMRDFAAIEQADKPEQEIQNVTVNKFDPSKGETAATIIPDLIRTYPNVYVMREFTDTEATKLLMDEVVDEKLVITTIPARDGADALLRLLQAKVPHKIFAKHVTAVLYVRLVRKLCPTCRVGYTPTPQVLKKLGIPAGKVEQLYRPPKPEELESDKPCPDCQGFGYQGRTGIFELLEVNDKMREVLLKKPQGDLLRKAARTSRQRSLQEEAILLVAKGVTSLPEVMRVLK